MGTWTALLGPGVLSGFFNMMQFNLVVSTNRPGIGCWQRNGFQVIGTLPGSFRHRQLGYVDALVMTQALVEGSTP